MQSLMLFKSDFSRNTILRVKNKSVGIAIDRRVLYNAENATTASKIKDIIMEINNEVLSP